MGQDTIISNTEVSFKYFLFKNKRNRTVLWIAAVAIVIQFAVFKYFYPFASYIHGDSFSYINAAYENLSINTYMVGYSNFLRFFSVFSKSDTALVGFQYLFIQSSALFFLFTLFYFYKSSRTLQIILFSFFILNPLCLNLANLISSDGLFLAISLVWFTLLIWIIHQPSIHVIILHTFILFIAFTIRYNALLYPVISIVVIALSKFTLRIKTVSILSGVLLCASFIGFTSFKYKQLTGYWQYSPFSGWQWANNAMYAYRYVDSTDRKPVPDKYKQLDNMIRAYFDSTKNTQKYPAEAVMASTVYMWSPKLPLYKYRNQLFAKRDTAASEFKRWASMGPLYKDYGIYIIKQYPLYFLKYFAWPNSNKYYAPPVEFLRVYNSGRNGVTIQAKQWFNYKSKLIKTNTKSQEINILNFYPIFSGIINVIMACTLLCYIMLKGRVCDKIFSKGVLLSASMWILNAGFTILASSAALRFQSFPILLTTTFAGLLLDWMIRLSKQPFPEKNFNSDKLILNLDLTDI